MKEGTKLAIKSHTGTYRQSAAIRFDIYEVANNSRENPKLFYHAAGVYL
jgi:hypothetical protein